MLQLYSVMKGMVHADIYRHRDGSWALESDACSSDLCKLVWCNHLVFYYEIPVCSTTSGVNVEFICNLLDEQVLHSYCTSSLPSDKFIALPELKKIIIFYLVMP